jgi:DhnA family fructose-bisphosphate aldolase class Ia
MGAVAVGATVYFGSAESNRQIIEAQKHLKRPIIRMATFHGVTLEIMHL